jgi:hypothetical protein
MSKKWTRRSALALIGSGAGLLTWGTGGFTDVTADRQVHIDTTEDSSDGPLLGITSLGDSGGPGQTVSLITLHNNGNLGEEVVEIELESASVENTEVAYLFKGEGVADSNYFIIPSDIRKGQEGTIEATLNIPPEASIGSVREYDVTLDFTATAGNQIITLERKFTVTYDDPRVSWWDFDEVEKKATSIEDSWGGITGTLSGKGWNNSGPSPVSNGLWFDGDDVITAGKSTPFNFNSGFSLSIWVLPFNQTNNLARLFSKWDSKSENSYQLSLGQSEFEYADLSDNEILIETTNDFVPTGKTINNYNWQHIVWTHSPSSDVVYINADRYQIGPSLKDPEESNANLRIGNGLNETLQYGFRGRLDDPKIYDAALTDEQVSNLYEYGVLISQNSS